MNRWPRVAQAFIEAGTSWTRNPNQSTESSTHRMVFFVLAPVWTLVLILWRCKSWSLGMLLNWDQPIAFVHDHDKQILFFVWPLYLLTYIELRSVLSVMPQCIQIIATPVKCWHIINKIKHHPIMSQVSIRSWEEVFPDMIWFDMTNSWVIPADTSVTELDFCCLVIHHFTTTYTVCVPTSYIS